MTEKELIDWFNEKLNNCFLYKNYTYLYYIYDKNYMRKKKLAEIENKTIDIPNKIYKHKILFKIMDYNVYDGVFSLYINSNVWKHIEDQIGAGNVVDFITKLLPDELKRFRVINGSLF